MKRNLGFTLVELMLVVAIIGILAAIAIPSYRDYIVRTKVSEGLSIAAGAKTAVAEAWADDQTNALESAAAAWVELFKPTKYVSGVTIDDARQGLIVITYGAPGEVAGLTLTLTPLVNSAPLADGVSGPIDWACASATWEKALARGFNPIEGGTVPPLFAPSECR